MAETLGRYNAKRDFTRTKEPRGAAVGAAAQGHSFVVQKHAASRLHYDFRLELDGVLLSWAVTKGPSLVPSEKRLAVHVEDHPLDYGAFEGTIPKGEYGGGSVVLWDRGTWTPEFDPHKGLAKGHLSFTLEGEKLRGAWHLVRLKGRPGEKGENWLLIKVDDGEARAADAPDILVEKPLSVVSGRDNDAVAAAGDAVWTAAPRPSAPPAAKPKKPSRPAKAAPGNLKSAPSDVMPDFEPPCLATLAATPPAGATYLHEIKLDGYRLQARLANGTVVLRTRSGLDWTARFQPIADAVADLPAREALLDGELVVEDARGLADFSLLKAAMSAGHGEALVFYAFDLLHLDGRDLRPLPLEARKAALATLLDGQRGAVRYSQHFEEDGPLLLKHVCRLGGEGVVSKRREAAYHGGRTGDWVKAKCSHRQEFVIAGWVPSTTSKRAVGSLVMAYHEGDALRHAGRVGTGYSAEVATDLAGLLEPETIAKCPITGGVSREAGKGVRWLEPTRVAEVEFRGWTGDDQLRHASFKGLREDKAAEDVVREDGPMSHEPAKTRTPKPVHSPLTHPDRVFWPDAGVTKQGLADFYTAIWPWIAPHVVDRPLSLVRCPAGIDGQTFFQKHPWDGMAKTVRAVPDAESDGPAVAIDDLGGLVSLVQAAVLEIHPWGASANTMDRPDRIILDLDPGDNVGFDAVIAAAREVRERLGAAGLTSFVKTSGGKGLHVVAPLTPRADWDSAKAFCKGLSETMAKDDPGRYLATMTKKARTGRIYVDYLRNGRGSTAVAAYSTRARPGAPVSTPLTWEELGPDIVPSQFTVATLERRLHHLDADPWAGFFETDQVLAGIATKRPPRRRKAT